MRSLNCFLSSSPPCPDGRHLRDLENWGSTRQFLPYLILPAGPRPPKREIEHIVGFPRLAPSGSARFTGIKFRSQTLVSRPRILLPPVSPSLIRGHTGVSFSPFVEIQACSPFIDFVLDFLSFPLNKRTNFDGSGETSVAPSKFSRVHFFFPRFILTSSEKSSIVLCRCCC